MLIFEDEPLYNIVEHGIWFDITEGYYIEPWYKVKFDCRFHFWLVLLSAVSEEGSDEKEYINHENYIQMVRKG